MSNKQFDAKIDTAVQKAKAFLLSKYKLSEPDLQDVLQESVLKALKNLKSFRGKCSFDTWLIAICKSEVNGLFRKRKRSESYLSKDNEEYGHKEEIWDEPEIFSKHDAEERSFMIGKALEKLSDKHREIIEIALKNSGSSQEVADLLKIPVNSARTRLFYAKRRLKKLIYAHQSDTQLTHD